MKPKTAMLATLIATLLTFTTYTGALAQFDNRQPLRNGLTPPMPTSLAPSSQLGSKRMADARSLHSLNSQKDNRNSRHLVDGTAHLKHERVDPDPANLTPIPLWSDTFTYHGLVYKYTMVGTDPKRGSATTVIPAVLIPLRFVFADGNVFDASTDLVDGQTPVQGIINSPIFQNYDFVSGGTHVGNTQYGDAFQRANFWDSVSTRSPNYHVLLGQPTVLPTQTINVPAGLGSYFTAPVTGLTVPVIDFDFLFSQDPVILTAANVSPTTLPIIVWGAVGGSGVFAYHNATAFNGNLQTYIATSYFAQGLFPNSADVDNLGHEVLEWMDDPFGSNFTPGWNIPFLDPVERCDSEFAGDLLEVADPCQFFNETVVALPGGAYTYHVDEAVFIDFFTRASRSRSVNGQYSFFEIMAPFGVETEPSSPCTGHVEFTPTYVEFPGASFTAVTGINNRGNATGFYNDAGGQHGFVLTGSNYFTLDFPGSLVTDPYKINDLGMIVGAFVDASGITHGFAYSQGTWTQLDFPGSSDTEAYGVNAAGDIVGIYDAFQPITHAFLLRNGRFQKIDTPFGSQSTSHGINDLGLITGVGYSDSFGPSTAFTLSRKGFIPFAFPGSIFSDAYSINNSSDLAGFFVDPDGTSWGMVTIYGYPYQVYASVFGNNNLGQICGVTYDFNAQRLGGFIGDLPLQRNSH